jgi:predicted branched-subunit amino acid permease
MVADKLLFLPQNPSFIAMVNYYVNFRLLLLSVIILHKHLKPSFYLFTNFFYYEV